MKIKAYDYTSEKLPRVYTPISEEMKWVGPNPDKATYFAIETVIYYLGNISYLVIILLLPISFGAYCYLLG